MMSRADLQRWATAINPQVGAVEAVVGPGPATARSSARCRCSNRISSHGDAGRSGLQPLSHGVP